MAPVNKDVWSLFYDCYRLYHNGYRRHMKSSKTCTNKDLSGVQHAQYQPHPLNKGFTYQWHNVPKVGGLLLVQVIKNVQLFIHLISFVISENEPN